MKKIVSLLLVVVIALGLFAFTGCAEEVKLVETYQSGINLSLYPNREKDDFIIAEAISVALFSDNTYECKIILTEGTKSRAEGELADDYQWKPLCTTTITRYGTYEKTVDTDLNEAKLSLGAATRVIYSTNAGGGHYPLVPEGMYYCDSDNEEQAAAFKTEWFGDMAALKAKVGGAVVLTASEDKHVINADSKVFNYESHHFKTRG